MGRKPCCDKVGLRRGAWTIEEDRMLESFILANGIQCWRTIPKLAGLLRCGKSCRLRWINYLRPDLRRGTFSDDEEVQIIELQSRLGNRWSIIASHFPGRTDNEIKNYWNTRIKKKLKLLGTHKPDQEKEQKDHNTIIESDIPLNQQEENSNGAVPKDETTQKDKPEDVVGKQNERDLWVNQETNVSNSLSSSIEQTSSLLFQEEDRVQQWIDCVDSMMSWDNFNDIYNELDFLLN